MRSLRSLARCLTLGRGSQLGGLGLEPLQHLAEELGLVRGAHVGLRAITLLGAGARAVGQPLTLFEVAVLVAQLARALDLAAQLHVRQRRRSRRPGWP
jgi:hypothetical protein